MKPSDALSQHREEILKILESFTLSNPRVFGSTAHNKDSDGSDLDLVIETQVGSVSLFDLSRAKRQLEKLTGVKVDLVTFDSIRPELREEIHQGAKPL
jgi:predicted nucleotidyltransferase